MPTHGFSKLALLALAGAAIASAAPAAETARNATRDNRGGERTHFQVVVPGEDRFTPFGLIIHAGDRVVWVNRDTDDHTIVSDDSFSTTGPQSLDVLLPGTDSNGGQPGQYEIHFSHPGTFIFHCRFHSHLDAFQQPVAPGPDGGIQDASGNFGTPMMGVVTVLP